MLLTNNSDAAANCGSLKRGLYIQATRFEKIDLGPAISEVPVIIIASLMARGTDYSGSGEVLCREGSTRMGLCNMSTFRQ